MRCTRNLLTILWVMFVNIFMKLIASVVFAAAVAPIDVTLTANLDGFDGSGESFRKGFFVPGVQRAGGLGADQLLTSR